MARGSGEGNEAGRCPESCSLPPPGGPGPALRLPREPGTPGPTDPCTPASVWLSRGDGLIRDGLSGQVAGTCGTATLGFREVLGRLDGVGAEGGNWAALSHGRGLLSVWETERRPWGSVDRGGDKTLGSGTAEGSLFQKPGYKVDMGI